MRLEYFQMIDRVVSLDLASKTISIESEIPQNSPIFEGHFPGHPLMPGVLLIETMAQTSGWLLVALMKFERMPFLAGVNEAKMRAFIGPGEKISVSAKIVHEGSGYAVSEAKIERNGKPACNATLMFRNVPFPNDEMRGMMKTTAQGIGLSEDMERHG